MDATGYSARGNMKGSGVTGAGEWPAHVIRAGSHEWAHDDAPAPADHRPHAEPWLSALLQAEHLSLLLGNGLTTGLSAAAGASPVGMGMVSIVQDYAAAVDMAARQSAERLGRGQPNIEDQIRAARELIGGLRVLAGVAEAGRSARRLPKSAAQLLRTWEGALDDTLRAFVSGVLVTERDLKKVVIGESATADEVRRLLGGFLLPFASRAATRERLHIFTTNYDRVVEYGCDLLGLRVVDRFVGTLAPVFRSSRLGIDMHYNPPGIRGEPRYLEGVVRLTKLHGSVDWQVALGPSGVEEVQRTSLPFGAPVDHPGVVQEPGSRLLVYPNPAKDVETLDYPYAELFRDFAAAVCQPNAVVLTYGYGFGDDHVNRVLRDMLSIPSTHLVIIAFDDVGGRVSRFCARSGRDAQVTLLVGPHFGSLPALVQHYLPKPAIDRATWRMIELLNRRTPPLGGRAPGGDAEAPQEAEA